MIRVKLEEAVPLFSILSALTDSSPEACSEASPKLSLDGFGAPWNLLRVEGRGSNPRVGGGVSCGIGVWLGLGLGWRLVAMHFNAREV